MRLSVPVLADTLQNLFSTCAEHFGRTTGLFRRRRQLTAAQLAQALVFGWIEDPDFALEELAEDLALSPQALHQRLNNDCAPAFFVALLQHALAQAINANNARSQLLGRFRAVYLEDCTYLSLPVTLTATGAEPSGAGLKLFIRWNVAGGQLDRLDVHRAHYSDRTARADAPPLEPGCLRLADGGFYDGAGLTADTRAGIWWVTRVPANASIRIGTGPRRPLSAVLTRLEQRDLDVVAGDKHPVRGRLLAWRVAPAVRRARRARLQKRCSKLSRVPSAAQVRMCGWTVLLTNLPRESFSPAEVLVLAKVRWQVELLIKRFKSQGGVNRTRGHLAGRVQCELYAKLLGCVVVLWGQLLSGAPLAGAGCWRRSKRVRRRAGPLRRALGNPHRLRRELRILRRTLRRLRPATRHTTRTIRQLLAQPALVT